MVDRYIKHVLPKKSKVQAAKQKMQLEWFGERLGSYTLEDSTTYRNTQRSPVRYLSALSHCYGIAVTEWGGGRVTHA
jgi:hypothetical protein